MFYGAFPLGCLGMCKCKASEKGLGLRARVHL